LRQCLAGLSKLVWNSLSFCLCLPSAGIIGMLHYT
jgi:hypothetical protein